MYWGEMDLYADRVGFKTAEFGSLLLAALYTWLLQKNLLSTIALDAFGA